MAFNLRKLEIEIKSKFEGGIVDLKEWIYFIIRFRMTA